MSDPPTPAADGLAAGVAALRGDPTRPPDLSVVVPISVRDDLDRARQLLTDLVRYDGPGRIEVVVALNRYEPHQSPPAIAEFERLGCVVTATPDAFVPGEVVCFSARMLAVRAAHAEHVVTFDADVRIPDPTAVLGWYLAQARDKAEAAYTHTGHHDLRPLVSVRARLAAYHTARFVKRVVLGVPTIRGGNFMVRRDALLSLHDEGVIGDELSLGPLLKARGARISYGGGRRRKVLTSGRYMTGGWRKLGRYLLYRLRYNWAALRTSDRAAAERKATFHRENLR